MKSPKIGKSNDKMKDMIIIKKIDENLVNQFKEGLQDLKSGRVRRVA